MDAQVYEAVAARAKGECECGCRQGLPPGELDHAFGRAKAAESVETCWMLTPFCHYHKTINRPSAGYWLRRFIEHCLRHGYADAGALARKKLEWLLAKGTTS